MKKLLIKIFLMAFHFLRICTKIEKLSFLTLSFLKRSDLKMKLNLFNAVFWAFKHAMRYIFLSEKAKKDVASIVNAI